MIAIAASDVPVATCSRNPNHRISRGTITVPPPTPKRALNAPAAVPVAVSLTRSARDMVGDTRCMPAAGLNRAERAPDARAALGPLLERPERAAIVCDIDGTLAPIVARPEDAAVPRR